MYQTKEWILDKKGKITNKYHEKNVQYWDVRLLADTLMWLHYEDEHNKKVYSIQDKEVTNPNNDCGWNNMAVNIYFP